MLLLIVYPIVPCPTTARHKKDPAWMRDLGICNAYGMLQERCCKLCEVGPFALEERDMPCQFRTFEPLDRVRQTV